MNVTSVKNFKELNGALRVLLTLISIADFGGEIRTSKAELKKAAGVCERTVKEHITTFCRCNMLKWKYSGAAFLNPDFLFKGAPDDRPRAVQAYNAFKSDITA